MTDEVKFKIKHSEKNFIDIDLSNSDIEDQNDENDAEEFLDDEELNSKTPRDPSDRRSTFQFNPRKYWERSFS